jgi:hypothetical protein
MQPTFSQLLTRSDPSTPFHLTPSGPALGQEALPASYSTQVVEGLLRSGHSLTSQLARELLLGKAFHLIQLTGKGEELRACVVDPDGKLWTSSLQDLARTAMLDRFAKAREKGIVVPHGDGKGNLVGTLNGNPIRVDGYSGSLAQPGRPYRAFVTGKRHHPGARLQLSLVLLHFEAVPESAAPSAPPTTPTAQTDLVAVGDVRAP